jgi:acyl-CoA oxidase
VINLGTKKHKDKYFEKIDSLEYPGCFAMTELHHGNLFYPYYFVTFSLCF